MNKVRILLITAALGCLAGGGLTAGTITIVAGGETDTLSISLLPMSGAVDGAAGDTVGWGYTVDWVAASNLLFLSTSSVGSETNSSIMTPGSYTDFTGGNVFGSGITAVPFDDVMGNGIGSYQISSDPAFAIVAAKDTGIFTFNFEVVDSTTDMPITSTVNTYSDASTTAFSVTVDASAPEPGTFWLLAAAGLTIAAARVFRSAVGRRRIRAVI